MELLVPTVSDVIFKYTWPIARYKKTIAKRHSIDSPNFDLNVNGIHSTWNLSIRFWKGPEGICIRNCARCMPTVHTLKELFWLAFEWAQEGCRSVEWGGLDDDISEVLGAEVFAKGERRWGFYWMRSRFKRQYSERRVGNTSRWGGVWVN